MGWQSWPRIGRIRHSGGAWRRGLIRRIGMVAGGMWPTAGSARDRGWGGGGAAVVMVDRGDEDCAIGGSGAVSAGVFGWLALAR